MQRFDPTSLPPLREVIAKHALHARKSLGQHFLLDLNLTERIVRAAGDLSGAAVVEIGSGPGALTRALVASDARAVIAIERDPRCIAALAEIQSVAGSRLRVIEGDALQVHHEDIALAPRAVVANLPYNIATPLLTKWLNAVAVSPATLRSMTLMFQKEVAARLAAMPGTRAYGRISVFTQWLCEVRLCFDVPARAFTPPPKVMSTVVHLIPRTAAAPADAISLQRVTAAAFGQRRKMVRTSLRSLGMDTRKLLEDAGIAPDLRAEALTVSDYCALARALAAMSMERI